jgi:hypothetical protein
MHVPGIVLAALALAAPVCAVAAAPAATRDVTAQVEGFAFDTCTSIGYGGMAMVSVCPVVLMRNGEALRDVTGLSHPQGLAAHKTARPKAWTRWQRSGGKLQLQGDKGWRNLAYTAVYPTLPRDFRLDGSFRAMSGAGTLAVGGSQAVVAWTDLRFFPDGRVERGGGAGSSTKFEGSSVVTGAQRGVMRGRYRIDGLTLTMTWDNGKTDTRLLITDPKSPKGAIWLDGKGYARSKP